MLIIFFVIKVIVDRAEKELTQQLSRAINKFLGKIRFIHFGKIIHQLCGFTTVGRQLSSHKLRDKGDKDAPSLL